MITVEFQQMLWSACNEIVISLLVLEIWKKLNWLILNLTLAMQSRHKNLFPSVLCMVYELWSFPMGSGIWTLGVQMMVLFEKVMETLEGRSGCCSAPRLRFISCSCSDPLEELQCDQSASCSCLPPWLPPLPHDELYYKLWAKMSPFSLKLLSPEYFFLQWRKKSKLTKMDILSILFMAEF